MARNRPHEPWFGVDDLGECWELAWDTTLGHKGYSVYGVTGWCRVIRRSSGDPIEPGLPRVHLCYNNPCLARWEHDTKYGNKGPPMHVQLAEDWRPLAPLRPPRPCHLPQSCILWVHRLRQEETQEETTLQFQKEIQGPPKSQTQTLGISGAQKKYQKMIFISRP